MNTTIQTNNNNNSNNRQERRYNQALGEGGTKIALFDYGAGNLFSLHAALKRNGTCDISIIQDMKSLNKFDGLVLPGVGNFDPAIISIGRDKELLAAAIQNKMPVLGICLGMELLFNYSEEGRLEGLKIIDGQVLMLDKKRVKVPHMGWNNIQFVMHKGFSNKSKRVNDSRYKSGNHGSSSRLLHNVADDSWVYFVHSYRILPAETERQIVVANSQYGDNKIPAVIEKGNIFGTQFHPEKSGPVGSEILKNFLKVCSLPITAEDK